MEWQSHWDIKEDVYTLIGSLCKCCARIKVYFEIHVLKEFVCMAQEPAGGEAAGQDGLRLRARDPHPRAAQDALWRGQPPQLRGACPHLHIILSLSPSIISHAQCQPHRQPLHSTLVLSKIRPCGCTHTSSKLDGTAPPATFHDSGHAAQH